MVQETDVRRHELAGFLRSRRERITPEQVGLPRGRRRRTPGLRREEVAHLSAVGVTWYTWLEQARDIQVSPQVLDAIARALLLDQSERSPSLRAGRGRRSGAGRVLPDRHAGAAATAGAAGAVPGLRQEQPLRHPGLQPDVRTAVLRPRLRAARGPQLHDPGLHQRRLAGGGRPMWGTSTGRSRRSSVRRWPSISPSPPGRHCWGVLRRSSEEFREVWARHEVVSQGGRTKLIRNAHVGLLHLEHNNLWLGPTAGPRLVSYMPLDEQSARTAGETPGVGARRGLSARIPHGSGPGPWRVVRARVRCAGQPVKRVTAGTRSPCLAMPTVHRSAVFGTVVNARTTTPGSAAFSQRRCCVSKRRAT